MSMGAAKRRTRPDSNRNTNDLEPLHAFVFRFDPVSNVGPQKRADPSTDAALCLGMLSAPASNRDRSLSPCLCVSVATSLSLYPNLSVSLVSMSRFTASNTARASS
jgi:hypothetical protein